MLTVQEEMDAKYPPPKTYHLLTADELSQRLPMEWLIKGVLPKNGIASLYGLSGSGKGFLVLDMGAAIAAGRSWFGAKTTSCPVVYLALEGEAGISQRIRALRSHYGECLDNFHTIIQPFSLLDEDDIASLVQAIHFAGAAGGLVIIDTLNCASLGGDENSSEGMGRVIRATKMLQSALGGLVLLVHHAGKDHTRGLRGHSSLHAALDTAIEVSCRDDQRLWKLAKSKDGHDGDEQPFKLEVVELGMDAEGETLTSCVVVTGQVANRTIRCKEPKGGNQRIVLDGLKELLCVSKTYGTGGAPDFKPCVELEQAITVIAPRLACDAKRKQERTRQAFTGLIANGVVRNLEGWLWLP